jgi:hypothetical protein
MGGAWGVAPGRGPPALTLDDNLKYIKSYNSSEDHDLFNSSSQIMGETCSMLCISIQGLVSSPGSFPAFQCCMLKTGKEVWVWGRG